MTWQRSWRVCQPGSAELCTQAGRGPGQRDPSPASSPGVRQGRLVCWLQPLPMLCVQCRLPYVPTAPAYFSTLPASGGAL